MKMIGQFVLFFVFIFIYHVEAVELNLPEKFDVEVSRWWITENGVKVTNKSLNRITSIPIIFHFNKNSFYFKTKKILYLSDQYQRDYSRVSGKGKLDKGEFVGKMISENWNYSKGTLHFYEKSTSKLTAAINSDGKLYIIDKNTITNECKTRELTDKGWGAFKRCSGKLLLGVHKTDFQTHMLLQLPINQSQSSQKFIDDPKPEIDEPIQVQYPKALIDTQTPISAGINIPVPTPPVQSKPTNPCKDPAFKDDPDWKTYCANKAANAKADAEYEKANAKEEAEYQRKLVEYEKKKAQWDKEEELRRAAQAKENEANAKRWREANKRQDRIDHQKIADDMQKRKAFQKQQQKNIRLINKFAESGDEWSAAYHRIKKLDQSGDTEKSKKIYSAHKKIYYDSKQLKHQADYTYEMGKEKALAESEKYAKGVRDTALTINKVAAKFDPTGMGDRIVETMENTYETIDAYSKGGIEGVVDHYVEKKASELSGGLSDVAKESIETLKDLKAGKRIKLKSHEYYYDQKGNRLTTYKKGEKVYNEKHEEVTYSFEKRLFYSALYKANEEHNLIQQGATKTKAFIKAAKSGDINGMVNTSMELKDTKEGIGIGADKVVKKVTGEEK
jgi:hypothetical protein